MNRELIDKFFESMTQQELEKAFDKYKKYSEDNRKGVLIPHLPLPVNPRVIREGKKPTPPPSQLIKEGYDPIPSPCYEHPILPEIYNIVHKHTREGLGKKEMVRYIQQVLNNIMYS